MLKNIHIKDLFGQFSYNIDLNPSTTRICFLTGPNGYGKTTILNILYAIYSMSVKSLAGISFKEIRLTFDDDNILDIRRERRENHDESDSDEPSASKVKIIFSFGKDESHSASSFQFDITSESSEERSGSESEGADNIRLFFKSHPLFYIRDGRLQTLGDTSSMRKCVENMKRLLHEDRGSEDDRIFKERLELFSGIIENAGFANKHLEVDRRYGFRFVSDNSERTILSPEQMSSGEQHLSIIAFELLFMAPDESLVLIDEPEISLHLMWQLDFLKNMQSILKLRDLQAIVATHSPEIFNQKWSLSVDLYQQSQLH